MTTKVVNMATIKKMVMLEHDELAEDTSDSTNDDEDSIENVDHPDGAEKQIQDQVVISDEEPFTEDVVDVDEVVEYTSDSNDDVSSNGKDDCQVGAMLRETCETWTSIPNAESSSSRA